MLMDGCECVLCIKFSKTFLVMNTDELINAHQVIFAKILVQQQLW